MAVLTRHKSRNLVLAASLAAAIGSQVALVQPVQAQQQAATADERMRSIETQLRALQRAVFPGGDQRFFERRSRGGAGRRGTHGAA